MMAHDAPMPYRVEISEGELRLVGPHVRLYLLPDLSGGVEVEVPLDEDRDFLAWSNARFDPDAWAVDLTCPQVFVDADFRELIELLRWSSGQPVIRSWIASRVGGRHGRSGAGQ